MVDCSTSCLIKRFKYEARSYCPFGWCLFAASQLLDTIQLLNYSKIQLNSAAPLLYHSSCRHRFLIAARLNVALASYHFPDEALIMDFRTTCISPQPRSIPLNHKTNVPGKKSWKCFFWEGLQNYSREIGSVFRSIRQNLECYIDFEYLICNGSSNLIMSTYRYTKSSHRCSLFAPSLS